MKAFKDYVITEGAKGMFIQHRQVVDDLIREIKRVNALKYSYQSMSYDAKNLEKALANSAKLARKFWENYGEEF